MTSNQMTIHLIYKKADDLPKISPLGPGSSTMQSGCWKVSDKTAEELIGGSIYFHPTQKSPSSAGGKIIGAVKLKDGDHSGRYVFMFEENPACKGVTTSTEGWAMVMKLVRP